MSGDKPIRHVVSIAGVVQERAAEKPLRLANALIRVIVHLAPLEFQSLVATMLEALYGNSFEFERMDIDTQLDASQLSAALREQFRAHGKPLSPEEANISIVPLEKGSTWQVSDAGKSYVIWRVQADRLTVYSNARRASSASRPLPQRIDQTRSQADGIFCFVDLPPGPYFLRVSLPEMGSRYGTVETDPAQPVQVQPKPDRGQPVQVAEVKVELPPTRLSGRVTRQDNNQPVVGAKVHLRADTTVVKTGENGVYDLSRFIAGKPTVEVAAAGFITATRPVELAAGQERVENFALQLQ